ncbi:hypothetical protein TeGR_g10168 [Tetraparma gracilis]|uniref:Uncharacterized protein n=1 Tax=Tetraparma gracilis TaxID=2962635 RepID=A0ABQ6MDB8_9STRA|nr:hypothetical protein TeGR_g10168 [Tetraparma gracilis]
MPGAIVDRILTPVAKGGAKAAVLTPDVLTPDEAVESPPPSPRAALSVPSPIGLSSPLPTGLRVAQPSPLSFLSPPDPGLSPVRGAGGKPPLSPYRKVVEVKEGGGRGGRRRRGKAVTPEAAGQGLA